MRHFLIVAATLAVVSPRPLAAQAPQLSTRDSALHALNRLAYGPRPGEVDSVVRIGVMRWIDQQLDPDRIDDAALQQREREFKILSYDREDLAQRFRDVQRERQRLHRDSSPPFPLFARRRGGQGVRSRPTGINENYARELLELHTLGIDGGYTQQDIIEVARIFTGWSIEPPDRGAGFVFRDWAHDRGTKH